MSVRACVRACVCVCICISKIGTCSTRTCIDSSGTTIDRRGACIWGGVVFKVVVLVQTGMVLNGGGASTDGYGACTVSQWRWC